MSTWRLPHREQTSRCRQSGTALPGRDAGRCWRAGAREGSAQFLLLGEPFHRRAILLRPFDLTKPAAKLPKTGLAFRLRREYWLLLLEQKDGNVTPDVVLFRRAKLYSLLQRSVRTGHDLGRG